MKALLAFVVLVVLAAPAMAHENYCPDAPEGYRTIQSHSRLCIYKSRELGRGFFLRIITRWPNVPNMIGYEYEVLVCSRWRKAEEWVFIGNRIGFAEQYLTVPEGYRCIYPAYLDSRWAQWAEGVSNPQGGTVHYPGRLKERRIKQENLKDFLYEVTLCVWDTFVFLRDGTIDTRYFPDPFLGLGNNWTCPEAEKKL